MPGTSRAGAGARYRNQVSALKAFVLARRGAVAGSEMSPFYLHHPGAQAAIAAAGVSAWPTSGVDLTGIR
eukprot:2477697-Rhodomonas_salina.1